MNNFSEKDWKLFRSKIVDWQEAYIAALKELELYDDFVIFSEDIYNQCFANGREKKRTGVLNGKRHEHYLEVLIFKHNFKAR